MGDTAQVPAGEEQEMLETTKAMRRKTAESGKNRKGQPYISSCCGSSVVSLFETEQLYPLLAVKTRCWGYWGACEHKLESFAPGSPP